MMNRLLRRLFLPLLLLGAGTAHAQVADKVDWADYLARHDFVWSQFPDKFESAAYLGNGQLGAMIMAKNKGATLNWELGRSDVAFKTSRIPIGDLQLRPAGKITGGEMLSLIHI